MRFESSSSTAKEHSDEDRRACMSIPPSACVVSPHVVARIWEPGGSGKMYTATPLAPSL